MTTSIAVHAPRAAGSALHSGVVRTHGAAMLVAGIAYGILIWLPWPDGASRFLPAEFGALSFTLGALVLLALIWRARALPATPFWAAAATLALALQIATIGLEATSIVLDDAATELAATITLAASSATGFVVCVGVVAAGAWAGPLRYLPLVLASWPGAVAAATVFSSSESVLWSVFVLWTSVALVVTGLFALAVPRGAVNA